MIPIRTIDPTGVRNTDAVLSGWAWDANHFTFGFPEAASEYEADYPSDEPRLGFEALNVAQRIAARRILDHVAELTNLTFSEATGASAGDATLRFGMTDAVPPYWAYGYGPSLFPDDPGLTGRGGDTWYNNSSRYFDNPLLGNHAYSVFIHEIGHALGLKHGHEDQSGTSGFPALTPDHDSAEYSVMTYRDYPGAPINTNTTEYNGHVQTFMMHDIAALQLMYGANFGTRAGNSVYRWSHLTGEMSVGGVGQGAPADNRVFMTLWDGGGTDTYNLSNYRTATIIDLRPGRWTITSPDQIAHLGDGHFARGNVANALLFQGDGRSLIENAVGGRGDDIIYGNHVANDLNGGGGADRMIGGRGNDSYSIHNLGDRIVESLGGGVDTVRSFINLSLPREVEHLILAGKAVVGNGNASANEIVGNASDNRINGRAGADRMLGAGGNDTFFVSETADRVVELARGGWDTISSVISLVLPAHVEALILTGAERLSGIGNGLANHVTGNAAGNMLRGGFGNDVLTGGAGADRFIFDTRLDAFRNADEIVDFSVYDTIVLDRSVFGAIAANGVLTPGAFHAGTAAHDRNDRIIYDKAKGEIYYDPDGTGAAAALLFARVDAGLALGGSDFLVVA